MKNLLKELGQELRITLVTKGKQLQNIHTRQLMDSRATGLDRVERRNLNGSDT
jgi:hypothetical protein